MITRPTVLILGAGASWDYGFPLGYGLRQDIIKGLASNHGKPRLAAQEAGFHEEQINRFLLTFQNSQLYSIDLFLHRHAKLKELGKFIIAVKFERITRSKICSDDAPSTRRDAIRSSICESLPCLAAKPSS